MLEAHQVKADTPELKYAHLAPDVWHALGELKRTGWVKRGIKNPETVQEHTTALLRIAASLQGLSDEEKDGLLDMLEIHDWPEVIHGDEQLLFKDEEQFKKGRAAKFENEQRAMMSICEKLGEEGGAKVMALWLRYANSQDPAASLARQIDKYQSVEKAMEYETAQGIPLFREFDYYEWERDRIIHPMLLDRLKKLDTEFWKMHDIKEE